MTGLGSEEWKPSTKPRHGVSFNPPRLQACCSCKAQATNAAAPLHRKHRQFCQTTLTVLLSQLKSVTAFFLKTQAEVLIWRGRTRAFSLFPFLFWANLCLPGYKMTGYTKPRWISNYQHTVSSHAEGCPSTTLCIFKRFLYPLLLQSTSVTH